MAAAPPLVVNPPQKDISRAKGHKSFTTVAHTAAPSRLTSLDAFRGLVVLLMLLVNNIPAKIIPPNTLVHAPWGQMTLADCVFPWFLCIVGVALPFAHASARRKKVTLSDWDGRALRRALLLVALGILVDSLASGVLFQGRLALGLGVLQLIGLASFVVLVTAPWLNLPGRMALSVVLLVAWAAILRTPPPGVEASAAWSPTITENLPYHINQTYLAPWHLRGLLSVIPAVVLVLFGSLAGDFLRRKREGWARKTGVLMLVGAGFFAAGLLWSHGDFPFSLPLAKAQWTPPYLLVAAGWSAILLGTLYALVDGIREGHGDKGAFPLVVVGANAVIAYMAPILLKFVLLKRAMTPSGLTWEAAIRAWCDILMRGDTTQGGWLYLAFFVMATWLLLLLLYRKKWFLRA